MRRLLALLVAMALSPCARAEADPALRQALVQLRNHVEYVDTSDEVRLMKRGANMVLFGIIGASTWDSMSAGWTPGAVFGRLTASLFVAGMGLTGVGWGLKLFHPTPKMLVVTPGDYISAQGLNEFARLPIDQQYLVAQRDPQLREFLIKLNDSYTLAKQYNVIPAASAR